MAESRPTNPPRFFDAPVSGGTAGAEKAILTFMVGAAPDDPSFPVMKEIFSYMGSFIHPMGGPSLGLAAKLSNNYLSGLIALATSEAMNLGMRLGLDPHVLSDCFKTSSGGSWVNSTVNPVPGVCPDAVTSKGYEGGFKVSPREGAPNGLTKASFEDPTHEERYVVGGGCGTPSGCKTCACRGRVKCIFRSCSGSPLCG